MNDFIRLFGEDVITPDNLRKMASQDEFTEEHINYIIKALSSHYKYIKALERVLEDCNDGGYYPMCDIEQRMKELLDET